MKFRKGQEVLIGNFCSTKISKVEKILADGSVVVDGYVFDNDTGIEKNDIWGKYKISNSPEKIEKFKRKKLEKIFENKTV